MNFHDILTKKADPKPKTSDLNVNAMGAAPGQVLLPADPNAPPVVYTKPGAAPTVVAKGLEAIPMYDEVQSAALLTKLFTG